MNSKIDVIIPIKTKSLNQSFSEHWRQRHRFSSQQKMIVKLFLNSLPIPELPATVTLTRIASRTLDSDNLAGAFKNIIDTVSSFLIPNLPPGQADGDPRITWKFAQEKGTRDQKVRIQIENEN